MQLAPTARVRLAARAEVRSQGLILGAQHTAHAHAAPLLTTRARRLSLPTTPTSTRGDKTIAGVGSGSRLLRVRVEIMGSQKCRIVGKSQSVLMMIDPIIFTRTRTATFLLRAQGRMASEKERSKGRKATLKDLDFERIFPKEHGGA
eukprot:COSAG01_NODE_24381_length_781_cov_1.016129_2_plen_146_part_01